MYKYNDILLTRTRCTFAIGSNSGSSGFKGETWVRLRPYFCFIFCTSSAEVRSLLRLRYFLNLSLKRLTHDCCTHITGITKTNSSHIKHILCVVHEHSSVLHRDNETNSNKHITHLYSCYSTINSQVNLRCLT